jgi:hypothetical protein
VGGHRRDDDAELIRFVESLSPRRRIVRRSLRRRTPKPESQGWKPAFVAVLASVLAMGAGIALAATSSAAAPAEVDCTIVVPADPLAAQGLATPYQLLPPCHESDAGMSAFVQATVLDPATGHLSVYNPLVLDQGTKPAAPVAVPQLPAGAVVGIWFGFNGDNLTLRDSGGSLAAGHCVNGLNGSIFGQYAYCGAPAFFTAANAAIAAGKLAVPALGTAKDGQPCPSTRDFGLVDMDQSDNVTATYLILPDGSTAQNTAANQAALAAKGAKVEVNGSDNGLLDNFVLPALGCAPFTAPDLADAGHQVSALALNELAAAAHQAPPVALVPVSDPMTLVNGRASVDKTNLYRAGVNMPAVDRAVDTPTAYCRNLVDVGVARTELDRRLTTAVRSPDPEAANTLFTFLAQRLSGSFDELGCARLLRIANPVTLTVDKNGVATDARFAHPSPSPSPSRSVAPSPSRSASAPPSASPSVPASAPPSVPASPSTVASRPPAPTPTRPAPVPSPTHSMAPAPVPAPPTTPAAPPPTTHAAPPPPPPPPPPAAPPAQPAPAVPVNHPTSAAAQPPAAGGDPAAGAPVPVMPVAATPAPTLTLGPMPAKVGRGAGGDASADRNMPPARLAGTILLSGGGLVALTILIRALVHARRRRYEFAGL